MISTVNVRWRVGLIFNKNKPDVNQYYNILFKLIELLINKFNKKIVHRGQIPLGKSSVKQSKTDFKNIFCAFSASKTKIYNLLDKEVVNTRLLFTKFYFLRKDNIIMSV